MFRQGDLLFVQVDEIPEDAKVDEKGILAYGEVTGHTHRIRGGVEAAMKVAAGVAYVQAMQEARVDHEEHGTITLPPGNWQVVRQREYVPEGYRQVVD